MFNKLSIEQVAYQLRRLTIIMTSVASSGHPTSAMSCADIIAVLFCMFKKDSDHFILSKGHAVPVIYAMYYLMGKISYDELLNYRDINSKLEGHPTPLFEYTEASTGSLGNGLGIGLGYTLDSKDKTYVLLGDSEISEGSIWEASNIAGIYKKNNLIAIVDANGLGQQIEINHDFATKTANRFEAFGWETKIIDGHNFVEISKALEHKPVKPYAIIAKTIKGSGVEEIAGKMGWHGKAIPKYSINIYLKELAKNYNQEFEPIDLNFRITNKLFKDADIATREAYGDALAEIGSNNKIWCLDAEVSNSTFSYKFKNKYPDRFIECFIAEQNMINMAIGLSQTDKTVFCSTFGAFLTRTFDQLRMASIGKIPLRVCGSHAGVSIGPDGPSQMALEDIGMFRVLPDSIVMYPCDANSTNKIVKLMANYNNGISYIKTTREKTPNIYNKSEIFKIGGSKILVDNNKPQACIFTAGVTVHFALEAVKELANKNILVNLVDIYSIKPIDYLTISKQLKKSGNRTVIIEDHYLEGGLGESILRNIEKSEVKVIHKYINRLPKSGSPQQLVESYQIDKNGIVNSIYDLLEL